MTCVHGCEFLEDFLQGISCEEDIKGAKHRGYRIRDAHCDSGGICRDHLEGFCDRDGRDGLEAQDVFGLINTAFRSPRVSSTRQKDEAYLLNQHLLKHIGRWVRWKTMPGICDKWDTKFLRTLICQRATSRHCLMS